MNLILYDGADLVGPDRIALDGRRLAHLREVHRAAPGDRLRVGRLGAGIAHATVHSIDGERALLELDRGSELPPPAPLPVVLCVAMSRPPTLKKVLGQAVTMGVKELVFFHARRVEKSYWGSSALEADALEATWRLGLEQARDTVPPRLRFAPRFRPFAEDLLPELVASHGALQVAHPGTGELGSRPGPGVLVVGPEGGLVDFEIETLAAAGARFVDLGPRILRVETAVVALLARIAC